MNKYSIRFRSKITDEFLEMFDQELITDHPDNCMLLVAQIVDFFDLHDCIVYTEMI